MKITDAQFKLLEGIAVIQAAEKVIDECPVSLRALADCSQTWSDFQSAITKLKTALKALPDEHDGPSADELQAERDARMGDMLHDRETSKGDL